MDQYFTPLCANSRHDAPRVTRHIGNHRRFDRHAGSLRQLHGIAGKAQQFFGTAEAGEFVAVKRVESDLAGFDGVHEFFLFFRRGLFEVAIDRPKHLDVPLEARSGRVASRLARGVDRRLE